MLLILFAALAALFSPFALAGQSVTLEEALALADQRNPAVLASRAATSASLGELVDSRAPLWNNPEIVTESRRRALEQVGAPNVRRYDVGIGLSQRFELGGQQQARRGAAEANQRAVEQSIEDVRRDVRAEVSERFFQVISLQQRVQMEAQALDLLRQAAELTGKRVRAGEDNRLDGNLAAIEAERGANQTALATEQLAQARVTLAMHLQLEPESQPEAIGDLDVQPSEYTLNDLLMSAVRRPKLRLLAAREETARRRLDLERGMTYPDLTIGLFYSPEKNIDSQDRVTTLSLALPLPVFRRNAAGIGKAQSDLDQARVERQAAERDSQAAVNALWQRLQSLQKRVDRLQRAVLPSLEDNQRLSLAALRAGEIGLPQFLLVRRQVLDGRRDLLEARTELRLVRVALETAAGWPGELSPLAATPGRNKR